MSNFEANNGREINTEIWFIKIDAPLEKICFKVLVNIIFFNNLNKKLNKLLINKI